MASRIIPGISLRAFWDLGESGWKAGMDENIWRLSFLVQSRVLGVVETLPPGPTEGDRYILNNDASPYDQHIMVYDQALWVPIVPEDRFVVFNTENDSLMYFNLAGNTWVSLISPEAIKEAYESNPNTNEFTDDEKAKLGDIEDGATADMSAEEIKAAYESNPNTNAFTDAEKAKLSGLSSSRFLGVYPTLGSLQSSHPAPAEGSFGYVDGGPLLDILSYIWDANSVKYVLQASAGGMETPETIKTKYESNEDTNAFTDAEKEKLALFDPDEPGPEGPQGQSAYAVAVANGFVGTEVEWLASLIGAQGDNGENGVDGKSAYEIAVENGFIGTISEWLVSLIGSPGTNGTDGTDGNDGADGLSAYQVAIANGFVGDEATWLLSLRGADGADGSGEPFTVSIKMGDYTAVTTDFAGNKEIEMFSVLDNYLTIPPDLAGTQPLIVAQRGEGQTHILAGSGVTLLSAGNALALRVQNSVCTIMKIDVNTYRVFGDLMAVSNPSGWAILEDTLDELATANFLLQENNSKLELES